MSKGHGNITDVPGIRVGHATDPVGLTGCTVVLCEKGAVGGVDQRGGAPGTRETDLLRPGHLVQEVHAVVLAGGSAFGLAAADGVMRYLEERGIGFNARVAKVPIVPAAILFDLDIGDPKARPTADMGYAACQTATAGPLEEGSVGAGTGARVGSILGAGRAMKSGIGGASVSPGGGLVVGALVAVNAFGDVVDPATNEILAGVRKPRCDELAGDARDDAQPGWKGGTPVRVEHRHRCRGHERPVDEGRGEQGGPDGSGWRRAGGAPGAHDVRWRHAICRGDGYQAR